jgi:hypothetical protein
MLKWLQQRNNTVYMVSFLMMIVSPILMYCAVKGGQPAWIYFPLAVFILANILLLLVR